MEQKIPTSHFTTLCDNMHLNINSVNEINLSLHLVVLVFKGHGLSIGAIWKSVGIQFSENMLDQLNEIDSTRLHEKNCQSTEICKQCRKYVNREKVKSNGAFTNAEKGPLCKSGKFHEGAD